MIAFAKEPKITRGYIPGVVCPDCDRPVYGLSLLGTETDRYGRTIRRYLAWCCRCKVGSEVEQFLMNNKWYVHRCRHWADRNGRPVTIDGWTVLNDLPEPAPIVIGPGGQYDQAIEL